ncbi:Receptor-type guanylate cyclase gcy [Seminavis robusta]|uniref:Receptor-type guanylate cyclase gcy n=1 Tax=Seminavis robusta TaxID=568900 RepID=A0A9N8DE60_9STRA|nr:Receptor-type guanylate cyclase gcy [Seminavis robusta]|eukprot:Sro53_g031390.1 Receptor-type guanylate cyclase gcy (819) ;mRNA; r:68845-72112
MSLHSAPTVVDSKMDLESQELSASTAMSSRQVSLQTQCEPSLDTADDVSCTGTSYGDEKDDESASEESIAGYENQLVGYSKVLVISVLLMFALSMGHIAFLLVRGKERRDLENHFQAVSSEVARLGQEKAQQIFHRLESLSASITFHAEAGDLAWPFIVLPDFYSYTLPLVTGDRPLLSTISLHPMVHDQQRKAWEEFSQYTYQQWFRESHLYESQVLATHSHESPSLVTKNPTDASWNLSDTCPHIWMGANDTLSTASTHNTSLSHFCLPSTTSPSYFPFWQHAPLSGYKASLVNLDASTQSPFNDGTIIDTVIGDGRPVLTDTFDLSPMQYNLSDSDRSIPHTTELKEPHVYVLQSVQDRLKGDDSKNSTVVAFLAASMRWGALFEELLPTYYETGIMIVTKSSCKSDDYRHTYLLKQGKVQFLGHEDLHPRVRALRMPMIPQFDIMPQGTGAGMEMMNETTSSGDIHPGCRYTMKVYPSNDWQDHYYTRYPFFYALAAVGCFSLSCIMFLFYEWHVQVRQDAVMDAATRTNKLVSNLYPTSVKNKLLEEVDRTNHTNTEATWGKTKRFGTGRQSFQRKSKLDGSETSATGASEQLFGSDPIAELFPESTIMFADLAGFTAWSSKRTPTEVFILLENLYHAFDEVARRRKVFKVETIGDCYVAVCGVPSPNKQHAVVMARFATDCRRRMIELVSGELQTKLGDDTNSLALRTGLHSGSVTAGVLRGDKSRFQLFGDTMNTASRMESTGTKGKIQCSSATASLLAAAGKKSWLRPREEKVHAKGKGTMETHWLEISARSNSASSGSGIGDMDSQRIE